MITGANGQVGRALLRSAPNYATCIALGRDQLDVLQPKAIGAAISLHRPDVIVNAAAYTKVDEAEANPEAAFALNAKAVANLAEATYATRAKLVHFSTDYVFDGQSNRAYRPADDRNPRSTYGLSKADGEDAVPSGGLLVRTSWVYASEGRNFLTKMLRAMANEQVVRVVNDQIGAPTWASRLAEIVWLLIGQNASGIYHYADAGVASWYDFAVAIAEEAARARLLPKHVEVFPIATSERPTPAYRPPISLLDSSATLAELRQVPTHWRANLLRAIDEM